MSLKFQSSLWSLAAVLVAGESIYLSNRQECSSQRNNTFSYITPSRTLEWSPCYEDSPAASLGPLSCARLIAPLDYTNTTAGEVQLAIIKLGAVNNGTYTNSTTKTVFVNPGGPGGDPVDYLMSRGPVLRVYLGNDTDIIGVVPRGVGATFPPIACEASESVIQQRDDVFLSSLPGYTNLSIVESFALGESIGADCRVVSPELVPYVGTTFAARDMDYVLQALGQDKLSYFGISYGTALGGTYAALFPDKIDRMVLDAVVDFNTQYTADKDPVAEFGDRKKALDTFFDACFVAGASKCPLWAASTAEISSKYFEVDAKVHAKPVVIPGYGLLTFPQWRSATGLALYVFNERAPLLAGVTAEILEDAPGPYLQTYAEVISSLGQPMEPPLVDPETGRRNNPAGGFTTTCNDAGPYEKEIGLGDLQGIFDKYEKVFPELGGAYSQTEIVCAAARLEAKERVTKKFENISTSFPILFVGNTADPATPLSNAVAMSRAFPGSRLLTINGTGHVSFEGNPTLECARDYIAPYFREGRLPEEGIVCDGRQAPFG